MSGQKLVDELRNEKWEAEALARQVNWRLYKRAADRIEAQAKEIAALAQDAAELAAVIAEALTIHKPHQVATSGSTIPELPNSFEQRCNWCDTPWPCRTARALSAVPADALSAYTTRVREEALREAAEDARPWQYGARSPDGGPIIPWSNHFREQLVQHQGHTPYRRRAAIPAGPWSEIPEGQNDNE